MPALQAHSTLRYAAWRQVIAEFVAGRTGQPPDSLVPVTLGYAVQGLFVAACEQWLAGPDTDLGPLIDAAVHGLASVFGRPDVMPSVPRTALGGVSVRAGPRP